MDRPRMRAVSTGPERRFGLRDRFLLTRLWISKISFSIIFLVFTVLPSSCRSKASKRPLEYISFQLRWTHQALFVDLYFAAKNGHYANKGLNVTFRESGPQHNPVIPVLEGSAQFGILGADTLATAPAQGRPVIAIDAIYRRSPVVFSSVVVAGITRPQDFTSKTIRKS